MYACMLVFHYIFFWIGFSYVRANLYSIFNKMVKNTSSIDSYSGNINGNSLANYLIMHIICFSPTSFSFVDCDIYFAGTQDTLKPYLRPWRYCTHLQLTWHRVFQVDDFSTSPQVSPSNTWFFQVSDLVENMNNSIVFCSFIFCLMVL